jgi:Ca2+-transporting ATPase
MILTNRSLTRSLFSMLKEKNSAFTWVIAGTVAVMCLVLTVPFLESLFLFGNVSLIDLFLALGGGVLSVACMELLKLAPARSDAG